MLFAPVAFSREPFHVKSCGLNEGGSLAAFLRDGFVPCPRPRGPPLATSHFKKRVTTTCCLDRVFWREVRR